MRLIGAIIFACKVFLHRLLHLVRRRDRKLSKGRQVANPSGEPILGESVSRLWTEGDPREFTLTAGKIHNLRVALRHLHGRQFQAGEIFSFWRHIGHPSRIRGFTMGREIREGCIVPSVAGGICQLSNALYDAALKAGLQIVERHAHSRIIPGSLAEQGRDATVFWNYIDLRFVATAAFHFDIEMTRDELIVRIRGARASNPQDSALRLVQHAAESCETCEVMDCFRRLPQDTRQSRTAYLVDAFTPEFDAWIREKKQAQDWLFVPMKRYGWTVLGFDRVVQAIAFTLRRSWISRRLAMQGAARQKALLKLNRDLAELYAKRLPPDVTHLVVAQTLLAPLADAGALGGRTYDVLLHRPPMQEVQKDLDAGLQKHPESATLGDFRVDPKVAIAEMKAMASARSIISPLAQATVLYGVRAQLTPWILPREPATSGERTRIVFLGPTAGRRGAYEMREAWRVVGGRLTVSGRVLEADDFWFGLDVEYWTTEKGSWDELLRSCRVLIAPAWVSESPRVLLKAIALGIPVITTTATGVDGLPGVLSMVSPSADDIVRQLATVNLYQEKYPKI